MLGNIRGVKLRLSPARSPRRAFVHPGDTTMANLKAAFEKAVAESKTLPEKPDNATLLKIYALYKQASAGDVEGKRPGFGDMVGRAKYDAWAAVKGKSANDAMQEYVDLIESLK
jgi:acyl-CoA-binding protein